MRHQLRGFILDVYSPIKRQLAKQTSCSCNSPRPGCYLGRLQPGSGGSQSVQNGGLVSKLADLVDFVDKAKRYWRHFIISLRKRGSLLKAKGFGPTLEQPERMRRLNSEFFKGI